MDEKSVYTYRFLARLVIETKTPINIGNGQKGIKTDSPVIRDVNGLPFIPGTSLAGLIHHAMPSDERSSMGSQEEGSRIIFTEARMLDEDGRVLDGIVDANRLNGNLLSHYRQLPIRQHARIGHRGATEKRGKFDEEVVLKGTRFCFEVEMQEKDGDDTFFKSMLSAFKGKTFRIGSGSRSGFGQIDVVSCKYKKIDLANPEELTLYLQKSSSLAEEWSAYEPLELSTSVDPKWNEEERWTEYRLELVPQDFVLFGSGFGDDEADMTYVKESYVEWHEGKPAKPVEAENVLLVPASSVKGALSHRVAFHYNLQKGRTVEWLKENNKSPESITGKNNEAVKTLFGSEGESNGKGKQRGNILISDVIRPLNGSSQSKLLNHVAIDRFTGGAIDGALFTEKTLYAKDEQIEIMLLVHDAAFKGDSGEIIKKSLESSLKDICSGMLPLGGGVNRGNGCFKGKMYINNKMEYDGIN